MSETTLPPGTPQLDDLPLAGVRVADFANGLAGPLAAMVLADLGADVVKVEPPGRGDLTRDLAPTMFLAVNRNKRSIALDVRQPAGLEVAERLVHSSDVVVESFRPGVMERLGLGADKLRAENPRLVYASVSGFGSTGPDRARRAVDAVAQAESGMIAANEGIEVPFTVVDTTTGLVLAQAVLAALVKRARTGRGERVEAALVATALHLQAVQLADRSLTGITLTPSERARRAPTAAIFETADGPLYVAAHYEEHWRALAEELGAPELPDDPRFSTREARVEHGEYLRAALELLFRSWPRDEIFRRLDARGVMAAPVRDHQDVLADAGLSGAGWITPAEVTGSAALVALPYAFGGDVLPIRLPPPALGADTVDVLGDLGYDDREVDELTVGGVASTESVDTDAAL